MKFADVRRNLSKWGKRLLLSAGIVFLFMLLFAFSTGPFWLFYDLGTAEAGIRGEPSAIVLMGGGGFPGESNLIRAYFARIASAKFPKAKVIIALPGDTLDSTSSLIRFRNYLAENGIDPSRIILEGSGKNTRGQCLNIRQIIPGNDRILVISSPEHLKRSVRCFRKAGFTMVDGLPAFENAIETNLRFSESKLGGRRLPVPGIGENLQVRYQFWTHLKYEVIIAREYFALSYYKLKGWI